MAKRTSNPDVVQCRESATYQTAGNVRLDREAGILYGVKVLGWDSVHGYSYEPAAVQEACDYSRDGYRNAKSNLDHAPSGPTPLSKPNVPIEKRFGKLLNPHVESDGLYGDYKYLKNHPFAPTFEEMADESPDLIGFSHDVAFKKRLDPKTGKQTVHKIIKVHSVDLVADPGTTRGLHESAGAGEYGDPGDEEHDASLDMSDLHAITDSEDEPDGCDEQCDAAIELVRTILQNKTLSTKEKKSKVNVAIDNFLDDDTSDEETDTSTKEKKPMAEPTKGAVETKPEAKGTESAAGAVEKSPLELRMDALEAKNKDLEQQLDMYRARESMATLDRKARDLCKKAGLPDSLVTDVFIDTLVRGQESAWEPMIADRKLQVGQYRQPIQAPGNSAGEDQKTKFERFKNTALGVKAK